MTPSPTTYDELAQCVLRGYLRSAVIIDDQWPETVIGEEHTDDIDESALIEDRVPEDGTDEPFAQAASDAPPLRPPDNPEDARLLAELQQSLLRSGLLACGFRYTHQARDIAVELARRADIVVLDWHLIEDDGADALDILEQLRGNGLRFVCIFTGYGRIGEVSHALRDRFGIPSADPEPDLQIENLIIAIRYKNGIIDEQTPGYTVGPGQLLPEALKGLANSYNGLVQLTMLELTQFHRQQLPEILERFDKSIDEAVLLEAGNELSPVGQRGAFLAVLVDEWRAHLDRDSSKLQALGSEGRRLFGKRLATRLGDISEEAIEEILRQMRIKPTTAKSFAQKSSTTQGAEKLRLWLGGGCEGPVPAVHGGSFNTKTGEHLLAAWGVLQAVYGAAGEEKTQPLLRLDALFHQQFEPPEKLTQGTVVAVDHGTEHADYYLCITPLCDAERPETFANLFTFLRTEPVPPENLFTSGNRKAAYCVVESEEHLLCLEVLLKQRVVLEVEDRTFDAGVVRGRLTPRRSKPRVVRLHRIAQLRPEHALSITALAAADASRVGVNRVELLRSRLSS